MNTIAGSAISKSAFDALCPFVYARAALAMIAHRVRGHGDFDRARRESRDYVRALRVAVTSDSRRLEHELAAIRSGLQCSKGYASEYRQARAIIKTRDNRFVRRISVEAGDVAKSLRETEHFISQATGIDSFARAALQYFELLFIHPFEDGNGRIARIAFASKINNLGLSPFLLDLSFSMRGSLREQYLILGSGRSPESYSKWIAYCRGIITAESQFLHRCAKSIEKLDGECLKEVASFGIRLEETAFANGDADRVLESELRKFDQSVQRLLSALLFPDAAIVLNFGSSKRL